MLNQRATELGSAPNKIRELFAYGLKRKAEIGEENVFDFSIGNPSVPAPDAVAESIAELIKEPPCALHGYTPSPGAAGPRQAVADNISRRFGIDATADQVYLTAGAAAGLAISIYAITNPGDEIMVIAPYFPEYAVWAETAGCTTIEVPAHEPDFQMDIDAIDAAFTPKTAGIIINSPNNPVGAVYTRENLEALAALLSRKEEKYGHPIYLISDEPYREITYGAEVPYVPTLYKHTIVCYSYSKSLSLPGERIGYIYVSNLMDNAKEVYTAVSGAGRALGFICTAVLFQRVMEKCVNEPSDVEAYRANRELLTKGLSELGYEYVEPDGAFYLWVRALESDDEAFCEKAKAHELLLVPATCFKSHGWVRISYCVSADVIKRSMPAFKALMEEYK